MLFDTHLHLIYPDILKYPWLDKVDSLNKPSHYEDYHIKASRLGISACLHMEVDVEENQIKEETRMIHNLIENNQFYLQVASYAYEKIGDYETAHRNYLLQRQLGFNGARLGRSFASVALESLPYSDSEMKLSVLNNNDEKEKRSSKKTSTKTSSARSCRA